MTTEEKATAIPATAIQPVPREAKLYAMRQRWLKRYRDVKGFEDAYRPPQNLLSKQQKDDIKIYHSFKQGRDGTRVLCSFCGIEFSILDAEIHHRNHSRFDNQLPNVEPACRPDNEEDRAKFMSETRRSDRANGSVSSLKKENTSESDTITLTVQETVQQELLKQAPTTFQKSVEYKAKTLAYLQEHVKEPTELDTAVFDIVALVGCSEAKAREYLNAYSLSKFAPFKLDRDAYGTLKIAPRAWQGTDPVTAEYLAAQEQLAQIMIEQSKPVCLNCSKHFSPTETGSTGKTCAACMKGAPA